MIFSLRQLQEKFVEQQRSLYITFTDITKAFDTIGRDGLWKILPKFGCPPCLTNIIHQFYKGMDSHINICGELPNQFPINNSVKQGCVLVPTLFGLFFAVVFQDTTSWLRAGVFYKWWQMEYFSALQNWEQNEKYSLLMTVNWSPTCLKIYRRSPAIFASAAKDFGLTIGLKKTEVLFQLIPGSSYVEPTVLIDDTCLNPVTKFCYLGSIMSPSASLDLEVEPRTIIASFVFGQLKDHIWSQNIRFATKCKVYRTVVISALLYGCEVWCPYQRHLCQFDQLQQHHLHSPMKITWWNKVLNTEVLSWARMPAVSTMALLAQLCWVGHVVRMPEGRLPKDNHVWSTVLWCPQMRGTVTKIQGCSTQKPQESQHHPFIVEGPSPRLHTVEECNWERCRHCWQGTQGDNRGKVQKVPKQSSCLCWLTRPHLPNMHQAVPVEDQSVQPLQNALFKSYWVKGIVIILWNG